VVVSIGDGTSDRPAETIFEVFYRRLLEEPNWLREPESEGQIATHLAAPKSSVREAIQYFVRVNALRREAEGIRRYEPATGRLISFYGLRLGLESAGFRRLMDSRFDRDRAGIALDLEGIVLDQEAVKNDFKPWLDEGFRFHSELLKASGLEDLVPMLNSVLLQIRISSFMAPDSPTERAQGITDHYRIIEVFSKKEESEWRPVLQQHIRRSLRRVLNGRRARHITNAPPVGRESNAAENPDPTVAIWREVMEVANVHSS
jgi:DNA-binding GntR family transcriptional regulator